MDFQMEIFFSVGWQIVVYFRNSFLFIVGEFVGIGFNLLIVKNGIGDIYIFVLNIDDIGSMVLGRGYYFWFIVEDILIYSFNFLIGFDLNVFYVVFGGILEVVLEMCVVVGLQFIGNSVIFIFLVLVVVCWLLLGDEVVVMDVVGNVFGCNWYEGEYFVIIIWGDDEVMLYLQEVLKNG